MKQVYEIIITDGKSPSYEENHLYFQFINLWAIENCTSYVGYSIEDVSDVSYSHDEFGIYRFTDEKDVVWFKLKWC